MTENNADREYVMLSEEDYNEMCLDIEYWSAAVDMLTEKLEENGIVVVISESEIWDRVRSQEGTTDKGELC